MGGKPQGLLKTFRTAHRLSSRLETGDRWEGYGTDTGQIRHSGHGSTYITRNISPERCQLLNILDSMA